MQPRNIIFAAGAVLILGALLMLVLKVKEGPARVPEDKLAQARASHSRSGSSRPATRPATPETAASSKTSKAPSKRSKRSDHSEEGSEPDPSGARPMMPSVNMAGGKAPAVSIKPRDDGLGTQMDEANNLYDKNDWEAAQEKALEILNESPKNVRMMRIVVSTACKMGQSDLATEWFSKLPDKDQKVMKTRCARYEVDLE